MKAERGRRAFLKSGILGVGGWEYSTWPAERVGKSGGLMARDHPRGRGSSRRKSRNSTLWILWTKGIMTAEYNV